MTVLQIQEQLNADELAFYFESENGVEAASLGKLLQRAATIAKKSGADLQVVALRDGSLGVVFRPIGRSIKAAGKEFKRSPVATTAAAAVLSTQIYNAILNAMAPELLNPTPLAKAAAEVVISGEALSIEIVSSDETKLIMDLTLAAKLQRSEAVNRPQIFAQSESRVSSRDLVELAEHAIEGTLSGEVIDVSGNLHFRPDGHRYLVPVERSRTATIPLIDSKHYKVRGEILFEGGLPELIEIYEAEPNSD
ncbi:hypothetical protein [Sulfitobacter sp. B30-2]|uniref:hypothetical protein n=1 Tax=Sulfitobacter sp. B30-2 TaxID=2785912 RepID=UPI0018CE19D1|nr:hypothetical protein [Sulfitobacter sp. B30-2]QPO08271.1 hypothetical protein IT972_12110 [Sulfitobacter sp. B30-2]